MEEKKYDAMCITGFVFGIICGITAFPVLITAMPFYALFAFGNASPLIQKYKYCMVYSGDGKEYICLEPQTWLTNCPNLNLDRNLCGFDFISPQTVKQYKSVIKIV